MHQHSDITTDSRHVTPGAIFCAYPGTEYDGRHFIDDAVKRGATCIYYDNADGFTYQHDNIQCIGLPLLQHKLSAIAAEYYHHPGRQLTVIGVTGTNGKTSTVFYIAQLLKALGHAVAIIGTVGNGCLPDLQLATHTTPDAITLQRLLAAFYDQGITHVVMEVSSHALDQGRVNAAYFDIGVLTNISQDHLDYHGTMQAYIHSKCQLMALAKTAVINQDTDYANSFIDTASQYLTYGQSADISYRIADTHPDGLSIIWQKKHHAIMPLIGQFNAANLTAALATCQALGITLDMLLPHIATLTPPPGRMMRVANTHELYIYIDYAHTPDALTQALTALRQHKEGGALWCLFGCGGDRDRTKRSLMAQAVAPHADYIIVTEDNSRYEPVMHIINDITHGFSHLQHVTIIPERHAAIHYVLTHATPGDTILLAGKGHETTLSVQGKQKPCDELKIIKDYFKRS